MADLYLVLLWNSPLAAELIVGKWPTAVVLATTGLAAWISSWIVFPFLGRILGVSGVIADLTLTLLAVVSASAIAGNVFVPGFGFLGGPILVFMGAVLDYRLTDILLIGVIFALTSARSRTVDGR